MDEDFPLLEINLDMKHALRVYAYSYHDRTRLTVSLENDDAVVDSRNFDPLFCPFTGRKNSTDDTDMSLLSDGITLKRVNGKPLESCCRIKGNLIFIAAGGVELSHAFPYDPGTGRKSVVTEKPRLRS